MRDTRIGRQKRKTANLLNEENIISKALKRGQDLAVHISDNLKKKVFKEKDLKVIEHSRYLLGASELVERINVPGGCGGAVMISNLTWNRFEDSSVAVDPTLSNRIHTEDYKAEYKKYCKRLETIAEEVTKNKWDDMEILERFLNDKALYEGIEAVISVQLRAGLLVSVESVVEGWISVMEHHASQRRTLGDVKLKEEMTIAVNGPELVHSDAVLKVYYCSVLGS